MITSMTTAQSPKTNPSGEDLIVWPDGTIITREELLNGELSYMSDDYEVVYFGSARYEELTQGDQ